MYKFASDKKDMCKKHGFSSHLFNKSLDRRPDVKCAIFCSVFFQNTFIIEEYSFLEAYVKSRDASKIYFSTLKLPFERAHENVSRLKFSDFFNDLVKRSG